MLHQIRSNARASASQTRLAMHRKGLVGRYRFKGGNDGIQYFERWTRSIQIIVLHVSNVGVTKVFFGIGFLVETDHEIHIFGVEIGDVIGGREGAMSFGTDIATIMRTGKGQYTILDDPIQVAVLNGEMKKERW